MVEILIQRAVSEQSWKWLEKSAGVVNNENCSRGIIIVNKPRCYFTETFSLIKAHKISDQRQTWQTRSWWHISELIEFNQLIENQQESNNDTDILERQKF